MTSEEKKAFYAQYWGRKVGRTNNEDNPLIFTVNCSNLFCIDHIELRTIENITDEEAVEVARLIWDDPHYHTPSYGRSQLTLASSSCVNFDQSITDYLRSIGILVGFRNFTPEMLIAEGVVKIKE